MSVDLLKKIRSLNRLLQRSGANPLIFGDICILCGDLLNSNVMVVTKKGKILDVYNHDEQEGAFLGSLEKGATLSPACTAALNRILETQEDANLEKLGLGKNERSGFCVVVPLESSGDRVGTLICCRNEEGYTVDDLILMEYAATAVGVELARSILQETEKEMRRSSVVKAAIATLSYSELEAVIHIFDELGGQEGMLVASKVADKVGITRSVIVNALRKFESAGIIESRSLGMKGTYIRILNPALSSELKKYKNT